jgi:hypothetical protein
MIFENESSIDKNLLSLVKEIKKHAKENPTIKLMSDPPTWIVTIPENWITKGINITWNHLNKKPYRVWWEEYDEDGERKIIMDVELLSINKVIDTLLLIRYVYLGIPDEVISYLADKLQKVGMETALQTVGKETDIFLTMDQMNILNIANQRGIIVGKKFGL